MNHNTHNTKALWGQRAHRAAVRGWPDVFEASHVHALIRRVRPERSAARTNFGSFLAFIWCAETRDAGYTPLWKS